MKKLIFTLALLASFTAKADIEALDTEHDQKLMDVALQANDVRMVKYLKLGKTDIKIVSMDSSINGDLNETTIVLTQEGGVGGLAGWENAFLVTPSPLGGTLKSAKVKGDVLVLELRDMDYKVVTQKLRLDNKSKKLVEIK